MKRTEASVVLLILIGASYAVAQVKIFPSSNPQAETPIAVNPTNSRNYVAAAITGTPPYKTGYYYTFDAGQNWGGSDTLGSPPPSESQGDPLVEFDGDGICYLLYQVKAAGEIYLHRSTDGGVNWTSRTTVGSTSPDLIDRPCIAISPVRNPTTLKFDIYVAYVDHTEIVVQCSIDGGSTFGNTYELTPGPSNFPLQGPSLGVNLMGEVLLAWAEYDVNGSGDVVRIAVAISPAGGTQFTEEASWNVVQAGARGEGNFYYAKNNPITCVRLDSYPRLSIDRLPGPYANRAYITWSARWESGSTDDDVVLVRGSRTSEGAYEWDQTRTPIDISSAFAFMPAVSVSRDGSVGILYFSTNSRVVSEPIYVRFLRSTDGGGYFTPSAIGPSNGFTVPYGTFLGDYHGLSSSLGDFACLWSQVYSGESVPQASFGRLQFGVQVPAGYQLVRIDQKDPLEISSGKVGKWNQGSFSDYAANEQLMLQSSSAQLFRAQQTFLENSVNKYHNWDGESDIKNHHPFTIQPGTTALTARFIPGDTVKIRAALLDQATTIGGTIDFKDPWYIDLTDPGYGGNWRNRGIDAVWRTRPVGTGGFTPNYVTTYPESPHPYRGVFLNENPNWLLDRPNYSVGAPLTQSISGIESYFLNWGGSGVSYQNSASTQTGVVFTQTGRTATAIYKGHLRTGAPSLTDAKNQRRAVSGMGISASNWYLVYESMGDAWLTLSTDNGASWIREERLNVLQGVASNPTISNVISFGGSDVSRVVVSWLEQNGGTTELHLQGMEVQLGSGHCYYGWNSLTDQRNSNNHKVITDFSGPAPSTSARPVIRLDKDASAPNVLFLYAYERSSYGIVVGRLQLSSNAYN
ncbi:MAG: hypothetical protein AB1428_05550 [Bacteroidota bacterium]